MFPCVPCLPLILPADNNHVCLVAMYTDSFVLAICLMKMRIQGKIMYELHIFTIAPQNWRVGTSLVPWLTWKSHRWGTWLGLYSLFLQIFWAQSLVLGSRIDSGRLSWVLTTVADSDMAFDKSAFCERFPAGGKLCISPDIGSCLSLESTKGLCKILTSTETLPNNFFFFKMKFYKKIAFSWPFQSSPFAKCQAFGTSRAPDGVKSSVFTVQQHSNRHWTSSVHNCTVYQVVAGRDSTTCSACLRSAAMQWGSTACCLQKQHHIITIRKGDVASFLKPPVLTAGDILQRGGQLLFSKILLYRIAFSFVSLGYSCQKTLSSFSFSSWPVPPFDFCWILDCWQDHVYQEVGRGRDL